MVRGYRNTQWRKIDLKRLDFSKGTTWPLEDGSLGIVDITDAGDRQRHSQAAVRRVGASKL